MRPLLLLVIMAALLPEVLAWQYLMFLFGVERLLVGTSLEFIKDGKVFCTINATKSSNDKALPCQNSTSWAYVCGNCTVLLTPQDSATFSLKYNGRHAEATLQHTFSSPGEATENVTAMLPCTTPTMRAPTELTAPTTPAAPPPTSRTSESAITTPTTNNGDTMGLVALVTVPLLVVALAVGGCIWKRCQKPKSQAKGTSVPNGSPGAPEETLRLTIDGAPSSPDEEEQRNPNARQHVGNGNVMRHIGESQEDETSV